MAKKKSQSSTKQKKPRVDSAGRTNDVLLEKCNELHRLYREALESDIKKRREFAVACHDVCNGAEYGSYAVQKAATHLGLDTSTIRAYAAVVDAWPDEEKFFKEASAKDESGKPLSWSHFLKVAPVENGRKRRSLLAKARKKCWSVRELQHEIRKKTTKTKSSESEKSDVKDSEQPAVPSILVNTAMKLTDLLKDKIPKQIRDAAPEDVDTALKQLTDLHEHLDCCIKQLKERRDLEAKKRKPSEQPEAK